jgi:hypothetical protein
MAKGRDVHTEGASRSQDGDGFSKLIGMVIDDRFAQSQPSAYLMQSVFVGKIIIVLFAILTAKWIVAPGFYFIGTEAIGFFINVHRPGTDATTDFNLVSLRHE